MMYKEYFYGDINRFIHFFICNNNQYISIKELTKVINISELPKEQLYKRFEIFIGDKIENILLPKINKKADVLNIKYLDLILEIKEIKEVFSMETLRYIIKKIPNIDNSNDLFILNEKNIVKLYESIINRNYEYKIQLSILINEVLSKYKYFKLEDSDHLCSKSGVYCNISNNIVQRIKKQNKDNFEIKNIKIKTNAGNGRLFIVPKKNIESILYNTVMQIRENEEIDLKKFGTDCKKIYSIAREIVDGYNCVECNEWELKLSEDCILNFSKKESYTDLAIEDVKDITTNKLTIEDKAKDFIDSFFMNTTEDENFIIEKILVEKMELKERINTLHRQYEENFLTLKQLVTKQKGGELICNN